MGRRHFLAQTLREAFPPVLHHPNKRRLFAHVGAGEPPQGDLWVSRWGSMSLPEHAEAHTQFETSNTAFAYLTSTRTHTHWHLNFASEFLFHAYGAAAFAQDEIQVAEHPALASLREALLANPSLVAPLTTDGGSPAPILVRGAHRMASIDLDPEVAFPFGIYGRRFDGASEEAIAASVRLLASPASSNIIAIEAPPESSGLYTQKQITGALQTAFTGFSAAVFETAEADDGPHVVVHTGHWGTGAYGGDAVLMATLQLVAARLAGVHTLVFHSLGPAAARNYETALWQTKAMFQAEPSPADIIDALTEKGFRWGVHDGN